MYVEFQRDAKYYKDTDAKLKTSVGKTLVFENPVWDDLNFDPNSSGGPAVSLPDYVMINNCVYREFTSANNQICGDGEEIPHHAKLGTDVLYYPHLHIFLKSGESAGTTGTEFTIYWELRTGSETTNGDVVLSATSADLSANSNKINLSDSTGFAGATELGGQLALTLARTGGNAGDIVVTTYGIHYPIDTIGSRYVTIK